jgi:hypothetical protein
VLKKGGKIVETTKKESAQRQTERAIKFFRDGDLDCAITLAAAAEGMLPDTANPHLFQALKDHEAFQHMQYNLIINWLKHSNSAASSAERATIDEFEATIIIARAITKFIAVYRCSCKPFEEFMIWSVKVGHLPVQFGRTSG